MCSAVFTWDSGWWAAQQRANMKRHIQGNWCFNNQHLGAPQDQWFRSKEVQGEKEGGRGRQSQRCLHSRRHSERAKNAPGAFSRWLDIRCLKVLKHHHTITHKGHVVWTTVPLCTRCASKKRSAFLLPISAACLNVHRLLAPEGWTNSFQAQFGCLLVVDFAAG